LDLARNLWLAGFFFVPLWTIALLDKMFASCCFVLVKIIMSSKSVVRPDTPCVAVCSTTFDDVCRGCGRTVSEVAHWVFMDEEEKRRVWQRITAEGYPRRQG